MTQVHKTFDTWDILPSTEPESMEPVPWSKGSVPEYFFLFIFLNFIIHFTIAFDYIVVVGLDKLLCLLLEIYQEEVGQQLETWCRIFEVKDVSWSEEKERSLQEMLEVRQDVRQKMFLMRHIARLFYGSH